MQNSLGTALVKCYPSEPVYDMMLARGGSEVSGVLRLILDSQDIVLARMEELESRVELLSGIVAKHEFGMTKY